MGWAGIARAARPDALLNVPVGTQVFDEESGAMLADMTEPGERVVVAEAAMAVSATPTSPLRPTPLRAAPIPVSRASRQRTHHSATEADC